MVETFTQSMMDDGHRPRITVAMPVYNGGALLRFAVLSIVHQTFSDWEFLCIDDGSSDGSLEFIQEIQDPRIRVIRDGLNKGLATRLNEAIDLARGAYFARMDQDDISYPERFSRQVAVLDNDSNLDLVGVRSIAISQDDQIVGFFPYAISHSELCAKPWRGFYLTHPTWMGRTEWFRRHRYATPALYMSEDHDLLLRSFSLSRFGNVPEVLFAYRLQDKIVWRKAMRTRWVILKMQVKYFLRKRQFVYGVLATATFIVRVAMDFVNVILQICHVPIFLFFRGAVDTATEVKWRNVLKFIGSAMPNPSRSPEKLADAWGKVMPMYVSPQFDTSTRNRVEQVVQGFGEEWSRFTQDALSASERRAIFEDYFAIFPWAKLQPQAVGADIGCGSGRWAAEVAPRVGRLVCIDASADALAVARRNLAELRNVEFRQSDVGALPFADGELDFAYSLGVLHHVPDTFGAITNVARALKPGGLFLIYLYYAFDNQPWWFRFLWGVTGVMRWIISRLPRAPRFIVCEVIAGLVYWPLARVAMVLDKLDLVPRNFPLRYYSDKSFYVMRTDALDRFGTRLEKRFTKVQIKEMLETAGFGQICFGDAQPYWCALGIKTESGV